MKVADFRTVIGRGIKLNSGSEIKFFVGDIIAADGKEIAGTLLQVVDEEGKVIADFCLVRETLLGMMDLIQGTFGELAQMADTVEEQANEPDEDIEAK